MTHDEIMDAEGVLSEYAHMDGTELGEYWASLGRLTGCTDAMSESFLEAFTLELQEVLNDINENYEIVSETRTITQTVRSLEYLG